MNFVTICKRQLIRQFKHGEWNPTWIASQNSKNVIEESAQPTGNDSGLGHHFQLTEEERQELLPSSSQAIFDNRVGWSKMHLMKARLLEPPVAASVRPSCPCSALVI